MKESESVRMRRIVPDSASSFCAALMLSISHYRMFCDLQRESMKVRQFSQTLGGPNEFSSLLSDFFGLHEFLTHSYN